MNWFCLILVFGLAQSSLSSQCSITIIVETEHPYPSLSMPQPTQVADCYVNYVYLVSRFLSYDNQTVFKDRTFSYNIIRNNYPDHGYFPFILTLLRSSTYSLIIQDDSFVHSYPGYVWINQALEQVRQTNNNDVITCYLDSVDSIQVPKGCLFLSSLRLRYLLTKTDFRVNSMDPFVFFSQSFQCRFQSKVIEVPFTHFIQSPLRGEIKPLSTTCVSDLQIEDIGCEDPHKEDHSLCAVLSQYKRTYILEQVEAIFKSSVPVSELIIYQNDVHIDYGYVIQKYPSIYHIWSTNWNSPFMMRNLIALVSQSHYHVLFDDDIIPGVDTIKVLIQAVEERNAPSGVDGRIILKSFFDGKNYVATGIGSRKNPLPVDLVIQVYIRNAIQTKIFWRYRMYTHRNGEDMHGSFSWFMECKRRPYVYPFEGSASYKNYGNDNVATFKTQSHNPLRSQISRSWFLGGYQSVRKSKVGYPVSDEEWERDYLKRVHRYF